MPSRDEPFGLVAVEFGRKGALGVGSRVGGLGTMPGWWFTIESMETKHLLRQFKSAIKSALASDQETRRVMRARSLLQRFPVLQWVHDLEVLQSQSIRVHSSEKKSAKLSQVLSSGASTPVLFPPPLPTLPNTATATPTMSSPVTALPSLAPSRCGSRAPSPTRPVSGSFGLDTNTAGRRVSYNLSVATLSEPTSGASTPLSVTSPSTPRFSSGFPRVKSSSAIGKLLASKLDALAELDRTQSDDGQGPSDAQWNSGESDSRHDTEAVSFSRSLDRTSTPSPTFTRLAASNASVLSLDTVVGDRKDFELQRVEPFFNDPKGEYYTAYGQLLDSHQGNLSSEKLCVEGYLRHSEKEWFEKYYDAKLGKKPSKLNVTVSGRSASTLAIDSHSSDLSNGHDEFNLGQDYKPPTGLRRILLQKIGDWPLYAFILALVSSLRWPMTLRTTLTPYPPGPNYCCQFVPSHTPDWSNRPVCQASLHHFGCLSWRLDILVAPVSSMSARHLHNTCFCSVRFSLPRPWYHTLRQHFVSNNGATVPCHGTLRCGLFQWISLFHTKLSDRGRKPGADMDVPCMHHPRRAADLHCGTVVLGLICQLFE